MMQSQLRIAPEARPRVLVVDDERFLVDLLADLLEDEGYLVDRACNGLEALNRIDSNRPDLILSDVMMPRMSGTQLVAAIRHRLPAERLPVVLFSAGSPPELHYDNVSFIPKTVDVDRILAEVHRMLSGCQDSGFHQAPGLTERSA